jgi:membrane-bound serine protease (ClpP class)
MRPTRLKDQPHVSWQRAVLRAAIGGLVVAAILAPRADRDWTRAAALAQGVGQKGDDPAKAAAAKEAGAPGPKKRYPKAVVVELRGGIDGLTVFSLQRRLREAQDLRPDVLIVQIDSPGGILDKSEEVARLLEDFECHTVAYVPRQALSGATMASLACDEIVMHPNAHLGDVGVIGLVDDAFRFAPEKQISDVVVLMRRLADDKGKPAALAEAMVRKDTKVFLVRPKQGGRDLYVTEAELNARGAQNFEILEPVVETHKGLFLGVTGKRALELGLADATAENYHDLQRYLGWEGEPTFLHDTWVESTAFILNLGIVTGLLIVIGLVGLYLEISSPGIGFGAVIALVCFGLFFWSHFCNGTANALEILLFVGGLVLLALELFVFPGFGIAGFTGGVMIVVSLILAISTTVIPKSPMDVAMLRNSVLTVVGSGVAFAVVVFILRKRLGKLSLFKGLVLAPPEPEKRAARRLAPAAAGGEARAAVGPPGAARAAATGATDNLVGRRGVAATLLRPAGKVRLGGRLIDVIAADGDFIQPGEEVEFIPSSDARVQVRRVEKK